MPLETLLENENTNDNMLKIMQHFHQYVPLVEETGKVIIDKFADVTFENFDKLLIGGDQLTAAQACNVKKHRLNSSSPSAHLDGLIPCVADCHTQTILL